MIHITAYNCVIFTINQKDKSTKVLAVQSVDGGPTQQQQQFMNNEDEVMCVHEAITVQDPVSVIPRWHCSISLHHSWC